MKVVNTHKRTLHLPLENVSNVFKTLATSKDLVWPHENWPAMKFKGGFKIESKGGHGRIRYKIIDYKAEEFVKFKFTKPNGFIGLHELKINSVSDNITEIIHEIRMKTTFKATILWIFIIRWLHNALIEDAFDKVENHFSVNKKKTRYSLWVTFLRAIYKRKSFQLKNA